MAAQEAGFVGAPPPWELVFVWICKYYGCLPSQLLDEPADVTIQWWMLDQEYEKYRDKRQQQHSKLKKLK